MRCGSFQIFLQPAASVTHELIFVKIDGTVNSVNLQCFGAEGINGINPWVLGTAFECVRVRSILGSFYVVGLGV
jgi:hypothetical protein